MGGVTKSVGEPGAEFVGRTRLVGNSEHFVRERVSENVSQSCDGETRIAETCGADRRLSRLADLWVVISMCEVQRHPDGV
jgi:hypothetical protein